jgi:enoyl-CoA hydratase/carnithine racemase
MAKNLTKHPIASDYECLDVLHSPEDDGLVLVLLNRAHKRNAIHAALWTEIGSVFRRLPLDSPTPPRAIVLAGNGNDFCAGIDLSDPSLMIGSSNNSSDDDDMDCARRGLARILPKVREMQACFTALEQCPAPVIAAVHGNCIGAGVDLIAAADVRWCTPEATFAIREVAIGLTADVGVLQRLPKIAGGNQSLVRELCLTGRNFDATEAVALGLVSRIVPTHLLVEEALTLARCMAQLSPVAVQGTKQALLYARDHSVEDGLEQVALYNALGLQGTDLRTAMMAYQQKSKTPPTFSNMPRHSKL